jgi:hypothetical protein
MGSTNERGKMMGYYCGDCGGDGENGESCPTCCEFGFIDDVEPCIICDYYDDCRQDEDNSLIHDLDMEARG